MTRMKTLHQQKVERAMILGGQDVPTSPTTPPDNIRILRARLILEEALETINAMGVSVHAASIRPQGVVHSKLDVVTLTSEKTELAFGIVGCADLEEVADGCADLSVVNTGTLSAFGIADVSLLEAVDNSNLTKFQPPKCEECGAVMESKLSWEDSSSANGGMVKMRRWVCSAKGGPYTDNGEVNVPGHRTRSEDEGPWTREDGKYMKPPYWEKPKIKELLETQRAEAIHEQQREPTTWEMTRLEYLTARSNIDPKTYYNLLNGTFPPAKDDPTLFTDEGNKQARTSTPGLPHPPLSL